MSDINCIRRDNCDSCNSRRVPVAVFHHNGTPVLNQCRSCNPSVFEAIARRDIDAWRKGEVRENNWFAS